MHLCMSVCMCVYVYVHMCMCVCVMYAIIYWIIAAEMDITMHTWYILVACVNFGAISAKFYNIGVRSLFSPYFSN